MAPKFSAKFGQNFIVENVSGGGTNIAGQRVARAAPDGHTLYIPNLQFSANVALYKTLPFDTEKDFAPIGMINNNPLVLTARKSLPANTQTEFAAWMKANKARMAHPGTGSTGHLATFLLAQALGAEVTHIPYRGAAPALQDILGGHVDLFFATPQQVVGNVTAGEIKAFGITSREPSPLLPQVPSFVQILWTEAGDPVLAHHAGAGRHARADHRCAQRRTAGSGRRSCDPRGLGQDRRQRLSQGTAIAGGGRRLPEKRDRALGAGRARQ